jgi:hypothetical protein
MVGSGTQPAPPKAVITQPAGHARVNANAGLAAEHFKDVPFANCAHLAIVVLSCVADETDLASRRQRRLMRTLRTSRSGRPL